MEEGERRNSNPLNKTAVKQLDKENRRPVFGSSSLPQLLFGAATKVPLVHFNPQSSFSYTHPC